jgi:hypothetical protein
MNFLIDVLDKSATYTSSMESLVYSTPSINWFSMNLFENNGINYSVNLFGKD